MVHHWFRNPKKIILVPLVLALLLIVACGTTAPAAPEAGKEASQPPAVQKETPEGAPTAVPVAAALPPEVVKPEGTLNAGLKEMGPFVLHPSTLGNPQIFVHGTAPIGEGLLQQDINHKVNGLLAESWSISDDFLTWTFKLNQGVQFHKGYGEMTSEDVLWSMRQWGSSKHPRAGQLEAFWAERPGTETTDPYTVVVNTGEPLIAIVAQQMLLVPGGSSTFIASKKQTDELGVEAASTQMAATGPWEIVDYRTGEFWRMAAVKDHWRQTPYFAELVFWEIPEESSRIAGFQTGQLDTFLMAFDTIPLVEAVPGARLMNIPDAVDMRLRIYGNYYPIPGVEPRPAYDPKLPWVSASPDVNSPEWDRARKVRKALHMAIDREGLVENILGGRGNTRTPLSGYTDFVHLLEGRDWPDFDPEGAKALLAEAGYPEGFSITLTPAIRGAANEVESCEVIAQMWNDIGLKVNFQRVPYNTLRPQVVGRTYQGVTCHGGAPDPVPADGYPTLASTGTFNRGLEHPYVDEKALAAMAETNPGKREQLEKEVGAFLMDNYLTDFAYYSMDAVWPVGPRLEEWTEHVRTSDLRQANGYEFIRHRQK
ncbi:MAG TPA: ABC transporter substrate-binding protein [Dehalococcoidia bacterium]|nr:ABC transporter substrate-binding protein [Dehalococcoidia bacterium]